MNSAYKAYSRASHTVAKTKQVVMLYDGAIRFLQQAKVAAEAKDISDRFEKLVKAGDIIVGLQSCLDFEHGGTTAQVLYDFYAGIELRVLNLHRTQDLNEYDLVVADLRQMRDVWQAIDQGVAANASAEQQQMAHDNAMDAAAVTAASMTVSA